MARDAVVYVCSRESMYDIWKISFKTVDYSGSTLLVRYKRLSDIDESSVHVPGRDREEKLMVLEMLLLELNNFGDDIVVSIGSRMPKPVHTTFGRMNFMLRVMYDTLVGGGIVDEIKMVRLYCKPIVAVEEHIDWSYTSL